jgi:hypothetical protein
MKFITTGIERSTSLRIYRFQLKSMTKLSADFIIVSFYFTS